MSPFWKLPGNSLLRERDFAIRPEFSSGQWLALLALWLLLLPFGAVIYVLWKLFVGAALVSGSVAFHLMDVALGRAPKGEGEKWQAIRAYLNNVIAMRLPHVNAAFRRFLFRLSGITIGRGGFIGMNGYMEDYHPENIVIEDEVVVSFGVTFIGHGYKRQGSMAEKHIILRQGCYVGAASVLLPGIEVGAKAIVGASSVVTRDVPAGAIVAGSPARIKGYRPGYEPPMPATSTASASHDHA